MSARSVAGALALAAAVGWITGAPSLAAAAAAQPSQGAIGGAVPVRAALPGVRVDAWRISYGTRGAQGAPAVATAAVLVPRAPTLRRPGLVGVALGTQGLPDACAPSRNLASGALAEGPVLSLLLARGYSVVVADGVGLGSDGRATYGVPAVDGPALLDAVRAARSLPEAGVGAEWPIGLLGYSVGGGSVAMAAARQPELAPDLPLVAAAAGGAPVDVPGYVRRGLRSGATVASLSALAGLRAAEPGLTPPPLTRLGRSALSIAERLCIFPAIATVALLGPARPERFVTADPFVAQDWAAAAAQQWPGPWLPRAPTLLFNGRRDEAVPIDGPRRLAEVWRAGGAPVTWRALPTDHVGGLLLGVPTAVDWLAVRLAQAAVVSPA